MLDNPSPMPVPAFVEQMIRPNILFVMFDQMSALSLPGYGHGLVKTPHLDALTGRGTLFENAYCAAPLCSPSRFGMLTGQLPSKIGAFDNATELPSSIPTFLHLLRRAGYRTCLSGKMDFTGADQLHGYEERLTTDLSPSDLGWTPDWDPRKWYSPGIIHSNPWRKLALVIIRFPCNMTKKLSSRRGNGCTRTLIVPMGGRSC